MSLGNWFPPLRWYHPMLDKCTWDLTWVHLYLHMPTSSQGELSLEQVSKARYPSCLRRFPACLKRMSVSINSFSFCFSLSLSWLWLPSLRAHGNSRTETRTHSQAKHSQVVRADIPPSLHYILLKNKCDMLYQALFSCLCFSNVKVIDVMCLTPLRKSNIYLSFCSEWR